MKSIVMALIVMSSVYALAAQVVLNPGDTNNFGVPLSCQIAGSGSTNPTPPPPAPPRLVGYFRVVPNLSCLRGTPSTDPRSIDDYIENCGFQKDQYMNCDSTAVVNTSENNGCFSMLYAKETMPGAIHDDQMQDLHNVCTTTTYACYVH